ncbi:hypothetical protein GCM10027345_18130 [Hymenobacter daeguensis]
MVPGLVVVLVFEERLLLFVPGVVVRPLVVLGVVMVPPGVAMVPLGISMVLRGVAVVPLGLVIEPLGLAMEPLGLAVPLGVPMVLPGIVPVGVVWAKAVLLRPMLSKEARKILEAFMIRRLKM